jgi:hypothetical protein
MAINHADGTMISSLLLYPVAAGIGAARAGAGWWTILFVPAGLAIGVGVVYLGRKLVYLITGLGLNGASGTSKGWFKQIFFLPFLLLYIVLPIAIAYGGIVGVWAGSGWVARHLI